MSMITFDAVVDADGVLRFQKTVGPSSANQDVEVTVKTRNRMNREEWLKFVDRLCGAWSGEFERPPEALLEQRDPLP